ncbi:BREX-1 system adenine-specific DNA-methyltransferase PglX [Paraburkholderia sp. MMS20-SJTN17]|uniref:site-specific DNA-methyltransferase (adenine-specific) n=1 Tax=Paraburkholderia translucens TaxID=2886945 RepID=A0ABS8KAW1_9BURK|nr:BREX-1 system adenine-specific DNA-methyltransferase PglX [Paraburkholderia sp. MMS20-SJTN17]MCC8401863.1 BREX-1 system adenine-specific DNA-methyltransferase PglX [Paraburkholderia sp. MMS20-SJTN17]
MAFDDKTRGRLQKLVTECRGLLTDEFRIQVQQTYGLDPNTGAVTPLDRLTHLSAAERETADLLRQTLAHYLASEGLADNADHRVPIIDRIVREQAFTVLNRLAALLMMEARGVLLPAVRQGQQSKAFELYKMVAGSALGETGQAYQAFLFSLFDEFAQELPALFDRFAPQGRLFPREAALLQVLAALNHHEIEPLWPQDETIGWIYQYFNSKEERKAMREASQAPRNGRELAVRNQFFTPRYVVEFLVDNTLGRLWYEAGQGASGLRERCQYLLCSPRDVFLRQFDRDDLRPGSVPALVMAAKWDDLPPFDDTDAGLQAMIDFAHCVDGYARVPSEAWDPQTHQSLHEGRFDAYSTQALWDALFMECRTDRHGGDGSIYRTRWFMGACQELLRRCRVTEPQLQVKLIPYRRLRDPRALKLLDPACGSMHFGLYAFDLLLVIYREAWDWEQAHGPGSLDVSTAPDAGLLPLCQTYTDKEDYLRDVPRLVIEHNIYGVDIDPRAAQIASLAVWLRAQRAWHDEGVKAKDRPAVGLGHVIAATAPPAERELREQFAAELDELDAELFRKTLQLLKGVPELGVLLQVERELPRLVRSVFGEHGSLFHEADVEQWRKAEGRLRAALIQFAHATKATYQGRLFAQDALQGLRLIDLCREVFDVVVMNPPFGALAANTKDQLSNSYSRSKSDLLAIMVERGLDLLRAGGRIGAITSRTCFFLSSFQKWREELVLSSARPEIMADLGLGVMDDAMVEAAAYVLEKTA